VDRHFYEMCTLAELRDRLRSGDIWVTGSRQYRDFETYLIPAAAFKEMQKNPLPLDIDTDLPSYMAFVPAKIGRQSDRGLVQSSGRDIGRCHA
jgi:hypothetical protein